MNDDYVTSEDFRVDDGYVAGRAVPDVDTLSS
jgi:hypothetical protein